MTDSDDHALFLTAMNDVSPLKDPATLSTTAWS